jgi:DNA-binding transcriptional LysR family regulator
MDRIDSMGVFAKVVAKQSFSRAARELHLSQAVVSKHVRALEDWLGAQLLNRTTRRLNVTEIGALVYARCERILDEIDEVRQSTSALRARRAACCTRGTGFLRHHAAGPALPTISRAILS